MLIDENPKYFSHLPVLRAVGACAMIRSVLEFGAGMYSTPLFLDRETFPNLEKLQCVEHNPEWVRFISNDFTGNDHRVAWCDDHPSWNINSYDLIFVDDGETIEERVDTLSRVCKSLGYPLMVVHDWRYKEYQSVVAKSLHLTSCAFDEYDTALVFSHKSPAAGVAEKIYEILRLN
jgi:hypothetical protein